MPRRGREAVVRVEHARQDRHQGDEEEVREGDAGQRHRQLELRRVLGEAGREQRATEGIAERATASSASWTTSIRREDAVGERAAPPERRPAPARAHRSARRRC